MYFFAFINVVNIDVVVSAYVIVFIAVGDDVGDIPIDIAISDFQLL
jgi:hypothetical protein